MLYKGKISSINLSENSATVILPELDGVITAPIKFLKATGAASAAINQFVVVASFSGDINDSVIILG